MPLMQTRWICYTCHREWIESANACGALPWDPSMGCPGCRGAAIEQRTYTPAFPGADLPREGTLVAPPATADPPTAVQAPPHALMASGDDADALAAQWEALCGTTGALV